MTPEALRERLIGLRVSTLQAISAAEVIPPAWLTLLAGIEAGLRAVALDDGEPAGRVVLTDNGEAIRLTLYEAGDRAGSVTLDPLRAIGLAGELVAAGLRRLHER